MEGGVGEGAPAVLLEVVEGGEGDEGRVPRRVSLVVAGRHWGESCERRRYRLPLSALNNVELRLAGTHVATRNGYMITPLSPLLFRVRRPPRPRPRPARSTPPMYATHGM